MSYYFFLLIIPLALVIALFTRSKDWAKCSSSTFKKAEAVLGNRFFAKFWVWWLMLTAVYVGLCFLGGLDNPGTGTMLGYLTGFVGMFVPFGMLSILFLPSNPLTLFIFLILIFLSIFNGVIICRFGLSAKQEILLNLAVLFVLTLLADISIYGEWNSLKILSEGGVRGVTFHF